MTVYYNNNKFSTRDQENNNYGYVKKYKGAWWCKDSMYASLNGLHYKGKDKSNCDGIFWYSWKGNCESLKWTEIKVRPKNYNPSFESKIIPY